MAADATPAAPEPKDWSRASSTSVKVFNAITFNLARFGLVGRVDRRIWAMTTTGRRSGRRIATPVAVQQLDDGRSVVLAAGRWRHNFVQPHQLELRQGRRVRKGAAFLVQDRDEVAAALAELARKEFERGGVNAVNRLLSTKFEGEELPEGDDVWQQHAQGRGLLVVPS